MTTVSPSKAKTLARRLLRENRKNDRSWRVIAREEFEDKIPAGTINRFALSRGAWLPKREHLITLGLVKPRKPRQVKTIAQMTNRELIEYFNRNIARMNAHLADRAIRLKIEWSKS